MFLAEVLQRGSTTRQLDARAGSFQVPLFAQSPAGSLNERRRGRGEVAVLDRKQQSHRRHQLVGGYSVCLFLASAVL